MTDDAAPDPSTIDPGTIDRDSFLGPFAGRIGLEVTEADGDHLVATWQAGPAHHQPFGLVNGGVYCTVVETLASVAGSLWLAGKGQVVGVNNNTDFLRGIAEGAMRSTATPIHRGRSQQLWVVETVVTDGPHAGKTVARGQVRLQNLYPDS